LFFADLAVKGDSAEGIIPQYGAVLFDEAHEVEEVAGQYFGVSISSYHFEELVRDTSALATRKQFGSKELDRVLQVVAEKSAQFLALFGALFGGGEGRTGFRAHDAFLEKNHDEYREVMAGLELIALHLELLKAPPEEAAPLVFRAKDLARRLEFWMQGRDKKYVYWIERRGRGTFLQATPIDVSQLLDEKLFDAVDTVILTSATLAVGGAFEFTKERLGIRNARTLVVESPFDYPKQACCTSRKVCPTRVVLRSRRRRRTRLSSC
jgi:ATP-dependent DNA helicase DinG